jgi:hypothetical protein
MAPLHTTGLAALVLVALGGSAEATHAVDHRYVVLGYVRDEAGRGVTGTPVRVVREKTGLISRAETDTEGFYVAIVHLHDEDVLDALRASAGRVAIRVDARFNPLDAVTPRGTRIDFNPREAIEDQASFLKILDRYLKQ